MNYEFLSGLVIKRVRSVNTLYSEENAGNRRQDRPGWALEIKYEGETLFECNGKRILASRACAILLPKGCSYRWHCTEAGHFIIMEFECDAEYHELISLPIKSCDAVLKKVRELEYKHNVGGAFSELEVMRAAYDVLLDLLKNGSKEYLPKNSRERLAPALEYIAKSYTQRISNRQLAALCGMSEVNFRKLFTKTAGTSPIAYIHERRIDRAKEMLRSDYSSLGAIARALGYQSLYDFSRDFKKHVGVSPSSYAKSPR